MNNLEELREHCEEIMAISPLRYAYIPASSIITLIERIEKAEAELSAAREKHGWIKCSEQMPDPNRQRRVCVFTPSSAADLRYRLVPANLFKAVCSSATHWHYVNDPVEGE
ncbi:DUF551 domain-containing protein [Yersinia enterocolitica]|uniref:DUF551 domain-containing protein n=1 Tax=Yersinia enterocolitica TaxID=630 RepID=UPI003D7A299D